MRRLLNALYRGGVTAEVRPDLWAVWRGVDRRRRWIGSLPGAEIDLLRLHTFLRHKGAGHRSTLCWGSGGDGAVERAMFVLTRPSNVQPFLDRLILSGGLGRDRATFVETARRVQNDSCTRQEMSTPCHNSDAVCDRLGAVVDCLSTEDCRFLHQIVNCRATKADLIGAFSLRPDALRSRAIGVLRSVSEIYQPIACA